MLNAVVQIFTLANALLLNFLAPMVYGLAAYGEFIALNATVFLVHRMVSIVGEPLIRFTSPDMLIYSAVAISAAALALFVAVNHLLPIGSPLLLLGILLSACVMLALQAMRLRRAHAAYLFTVSILFSWLLLWSATHDLSLPLVRVMELSIGIPAAGWLLFVLERSAHAPRGCAVWKTLAALLVRMPKMLSITAVMSMFTSALPVFLARALVPYDMGLLRVTISVIQSATAMFPVSTQALLASFVHHQRGGEFYRLLISIATLYFAAVAATLLLLGLFIPDLAPVMVLAVCLPAFYRAILVERHCLARHHIRPLVIVNITVVAAALALLPYIQTVPQAALLYAAGFALYAAALSLVERDGWSQLPSLLVMLACPLAVLSGDMRVSLVYVALVALVEWLRHKPTRADIALLWREL